MSSFESNNIEIYVMGENGGLMCYSIAVGDTDKLYCLRCPASLLEYRPVAKMRKTNIKLDTRDYNLTLPSWFDTNGLNDVDSNSDYIETPGKWYDQQFKFDGEGYEGDVSRDGVESEVSSEKKGERESDFNMGYEEMDYVGEDDDMNLGIEVGNNLCLDSIDKKGKNEKIEVFKSKEKEKINFKKNVEDKENREPLERRGFSIKNRRPVFVKTSNSEIDQCYDPFKLPVVSDNMCHALRFWLAYKYMFESSFSVMDIAVHFDFYYSSLLKYKNKRVFKIEDNGFLSPGEYNRKTAGKIVTSYGRVEDIEEYERNKKRK